MNTLEINYPAPPITVMDPVAQTVTLLVGSLLLLLCLVYASRMSTKYKTWLPVLFFAAGFCNIFLEPIVCVLGHCIHAVEGQLTLFETNGRPIPVHVAILYAVYFGIVWIMLYPRFRSKTLTSGFLWKAYLANCLFAFVFEILPVSYGLWVYYDYQALWVWKSTVPLFWAMINPVCVLAGFTLICKFHNLLQGWKTILIFPLSWIGAFTHLIAGFPYYSAVNSTAGPAAIQLSGLASVGMGVFIVWICINELEEIQNLKQVKAFNHGTC